MNQIEIKIFSSSSHLWEFDWQSSETFKYETIVNKLSSVDISQNVKSSCSTKEDFFLLVINYIIYVSLNMVKWLSIDDDCCSHVCVHLTIFNRIWLANWYLITWNTIDHHDCRRRRHRLNKNTDTRMTYCKSCINDIKWTHKEYIY